MQKIRASYLMILGLLSLQMLTTFTATVKVIDTFDEGEIAVTEPVCTDTPSGNTIFDISNNIFAYATAQDMSIQGIVFKIQPEGSDSNGGNGTGSGSGSCEPCDGTNCPTCQEVACEDCNTDELLHYRYIFNRNDLQRSIAIAAQEYILVTHGVIEQGANNFYDIVKESFMDGQTDFTVQTQEGKFSHDIVILTIDGTETAFLVKYFRDEQWHVVYAVTERYDSGDTSVVFVNTNDLSMELALYVVTYTSTTTVSGYGFTIEYLTITDPNTIDIVEVFVNEQTNEVERERVLISAVSQAARHHHETHSLDTTGLWFVQEVNFGNLVSEFVVYHTDITGKVLHTYSTQVSLEDHYTNFYKVVLDDQSGHTHTIRIVVSEKSVADFFDNAIIENTSAVHITEAQVVFTGNYFQIFTTVSSFETTDPDFEKEVNGVTDGESEVVVSEHSIAAVAALSQWALSLRKDDITLTHVYYTSNNAEVQVHHTNGDVYTGEVSQLTFQNINSLYAVTITYPNTQKAAFYVYVTKNSDSTFDVSVLHGGAYVIATYRLAIENVHGTLNYIINTVSLVGSEEHQGGVDEVDPIVGPSTGVDPNGKHPTNEIQDLTITFTLELVTEKVEQTITHIYEVYDHPVIEGYTFHIKDGVVYNQLSGTVFLEGGLTVLLQYFATSVSTTTQNGDILYTYKFSGETFKITSNGKVYRQPGDTYFTDGGLEGLLAILCRRDDIVETVTLTYNLYEVAELDTQYKVWSNGDVTQVPNDHHVITTGGYDGLVAYLTGLLEFNEAYQAEYYIAVDVRTGDHYFIYPDGTVTEIDGTYVCDGGAHGLLIYLRSLVIDISIQVTYPDYYEVTTSLGIIFRLYFNGDVTDNEGTFVCRSDLPCLQQYLEEHFPGTAIDEPVRVTYQVFTYDGDMYILYPDGNIHKNDGTFICGGGLEGFRLWLIEQASTQTVVSVTYQIVTDKNTGDKYYVYESGKVTTDDGELICLIGGIECLNDFLFGKHDEDGAKVTPTDESELEMDYTYKFYVDANGVVYKHDESTGAVLKEQNGEWIGVFVIYESFWNDKEYTHSESGHMVVLVQKYEVQGTSDVYYVSEHSFVLNKNLAIISDGGLQGLLRYLNTLVTVTINVNAIDDVSENQHVHQINFGYEFNLANHHYIDHNNNNAVFCQRSSNEKAEDCFITFLSKYYYDQIISSTSKPSFETLVDSEGITYYIYPNGLVVDENGNIICATGGRDCLDTYLCALYKCDEEVIVVPEPETTGMISIFYYKYQTSSGAQAKYFLNGTLIEDSGARSEDLEAIAKLQGGWTLVGEGFVDQELTYALVIVKGYHDSAESEAQFAILSDGSIWYEFNYFCGFGDVDYLVQFLEVKKGTSISSTGSTITVHNINQDFTIKYNPDRLFNEDGQEICRKNGFDGLYYCLLTHLTVNHYVDIISPVAVDDFEVFTIEGIDYHVYPDGSVTDNQGNFVTDGGITALLEFVFNLNREVQVQGTAQVDFWEMALTYTDASGNQYRRYGTGQVINWSTKEDATSLLGELTFTGFVKETSTETVTVLYDTVYDITYYLLDDGRTFFASDMRQASNGGLVGFHNWRITYYNTQGEHFENTNKVTFAGLNNLTYTLERPHDGWQAFNPTQEEVVIPRHDQYEALYLLHEDLYMSGHYQLSHSLVYVYSIYADMNGMHYRVYNQHGVVTTDDSLQLVISKTGGLTSLTNYLTSNHLVLLPNWWQEVWESTNSERYVITYIDGTVHTFPGGHLVCEASTTPKDCLTEHVNDIDAAVLGLDYIIYLYKDVGYGSFKNGSVTYHNDGTPICEAPTEDERKNCLLEHLAVLEGVGDKVTYTLHKAAHSGEVFRVYVSGTVTKDNNGVEGEIIAVTGGYQALLDYVYLQLDMESFQVVTTDDGREFHVYNNGTVIEDPSREVVCTEGGIPCLEDWLKMNSYQIYDVDGTLFQVFENGTVYFYPGGDLLCLHGGKTCIDDWIAANSYYLYIIEGHNVRIYGDGRSTFENGTEICKTGGEPCVDAYFESLKPQFETWEVEGRYFEVYPDGSVIETTGGKRETVCVTGGIQCVYDFIYYDIYTVDPYTFHIYGNGTGTFDDGTVVCETGGKPCIDEWLKNNHPYQVTATVDGEVLTFDVYEGSGRVVDSNGNEICATGGEPCLEEYIRSITPQNYEVKSGALTYNFKVYPDGRVTDENGNVICETGGSDCLNAWIEANVPTHHLHTNGEYYYIFPNGTVWDNNLVVVCETGGLECLNEDETIINYEELVYQRDDGRHIVTLRLFENGAVDLDSNYTVVCESGGRACADQWVNDNYPDYYEFPIEATNFFLDAYLYLNGTSKRPSDGATICELGATEYLYSNTMQGVDCVTWYFYWYYPEPVLMEIGPFMWDFYVYTWGNGSSYRSEDWQIICDQGGADCLAAWGDSQKPTIHTDHKTGDKYYEFPTKEVYDAAGNMICSEGGYDCLNAYINGQAHAGITVEAAAGIGLDLSVSVGAGASIGLSQKTEVKSTARMYVISVIVFMAALYTAYALYKKQQEANEKKQSSQYLRESLLSGDFKEHVI